MTERAAVTRDEVVERVAEAVCRADTGHRMTECDDVLQGRFQRLADAAIEAHLAAHYTSYVDEEHQGGNLLELFIQVAGALSRRDTELQKTREELNFVGEEFARLQADHTRAATSLAEAREELGRRLRQGQTAMIMLALLRPDLEVLVQHTDVDAFNDDARLPALMDWVRDRMTEEKERGRSVTPEAYARAVKAGTLAQLHKTHERMTNGTHVDNTIYLSAIAPAIVQALGLSIEDPESAALLGLATIREVHANDARHSLGDEMKDEE